jgi:glutamate racemase
MSDNSATKPIGVFDSGIGGLTVVSEILRTLPNESIVYFGDTARVPYGTKSEETVRLFARQDAAFLLGHDVKLIVVACNTASAVAVDKLRAFSAVPVLGVIEPGAKAAAQATSTGKVGVIGTQATIDSHAYRREITRIKSGIEVLERSCPLFVPLAEEGWIEHEATKLVVGEYLQDMIAEGIDTLVLGCTHYPILKKTISGVVGSDISLVDSAEEMAKDVAVLLERESLLSPSSKSDLKLYVSDIPRRFQEVGERFLGRKLPEVELVSEDVLIQNQLERST